MSLSGGRRENHDVDNFDDKTAKRHLNMDAAPCYYKWMGLDGMGIFGWFVVL